MKITIEGEPSEVLPLLKQLQIAPTPPAPLRNDMIPAWQPSPWWGVDYTRPTTGIPFSFEKDVVICTTLKIPE